MEMIRISLVALLRFVVTSLIAVELTRKIFLSLAATLLGLGVMMVFSASITSRPSQVEQVFLSRHLVFLTFGIAAGGIAAHIPARWWRALSPYIYWLALFLLVLVLIPGVGAKVNGARRWFRSGSLSGQPSELMKIALPLYVCCLTVRRQKSLGSWRDGILQTAYPIVLAAGIIMVEPDLGTALFLAASGGMSLWISGWPVRNFVAAVAVAVPVVGVGVLSRPYQMRRISDFLETWTDWTQAPYHLKQSLVTLGAGGFWGAGLGKGFQKLSFLPEANTDFVFAVVGEELGLVGALFVIVLWIGLYVSGLQLLKNAANDPFSARAAFVLLTQLAFQAMINIAVVTAMVPPKGIAHPLISYGGSNLVITLTAIGVFLGLTRHVPDASLAERGLPKAIGDCNFPSRIDESVENGRLRQLQ